MSWMMMLVTQSATTGTLFLLTRENTAGMSFDLPAANITSAQISAQARYAPSTETISPTLTKIAPQGPMTDSSTPAIDGWRRPAMSARCSTEYGSSVTST